MFEKKAIQQGLCLKDAAQIVLSQNEVSARLCGDMVGQRCEKGCMKSFSQSQQDPLFKLGIHPMKNIEVDQQIVDAVVIFDGESITTHLYPLDELNEQKLALMREKGLSKTELNVMSHVLKGSNNEEISKKLYISKVTLKTHLNNIYKKLPQSLRPTRS